MPRHKQRMPLELGLSLNVNELLREGFIEPGQSSPPKDCHWLDDDGEVRATAVISASTTIRPSATGYGEMHVVANWIDQTIRLAAQPRHFGGRQWYFVCPRANQRVSVLWSPPGKRFFAGRKSWGSDVAYLSQYYAAGPRAHYMANKLCDRIGGPGASELWEVPPKPMWMRWRTYERLVESCERYRDSATTLPIKYRLARGVI